MKIGFIIPSHWALITPGDGRKAQIVKQMAALERIGHSAVPINSWDLEAVKSCDALQIVEAAFGNYVGVTEHPAVPLVGVSPFIDSNQPFYKYRLMAWLGTRHPLLRNVPGTFRQQMLHADLVIVRSKHEQERIVRGLGINRAKAKIVLNGVDPPTQHDPDLARRQFNLPQEYLLHAGYYNESRKNTVRLIEAIASTDLPLVIVGNAQPTAYRNEVLAAAAKNKQVTILPYVERAVLESLYAGCRVFCLPSIHEGTGLVALEAAAHGAGVVITQNGGPPDYFGDLAYYVDPLKVQTIRTAILAAWENPKSAEIKQHVLSRLTWDQSAQSLVRAYQEIAATKA